MIITIAIGQKSPTLDEVRAALAQASDKIADVDDFEVLADGDLLHPDGGLLGGWSVEP